jgi:hypothetical protein
MKHPRHIATDILIPTTGHRRGISGIQVSAAEQLSKAVTPSHLRIRRRSKQIAQLAQLQRFALSIPRIGASRQLNKISAQHGSDKRARYRQGGDIYHFFVSSMMILQI